MQDKKIEVKNFEVTKDKIIFHGRIDFISEENSIIIFIPGVSGKALTDKFDWLSKIFTDVGYNFVRFNFRGYEDNNNFEESSLENELEDFRNLLDKLKEMGFNIEKYGIVAKSIGALKAISVQDLKLRCLGLFAPAINLDKDSNLSKMAKVLYKNIGKYCDYKLSFGMLNCHISSIVFYGDNDQVVDVKDTKNLFKHLPYPKELYCIANEDHSLEKDNTKIFIKEKIATFFQKFL